MNMMGFLRRLLHHHRAMRGFLSPQPGDHGTWDLGFRIETGTRIACGELAGKYSDAIEKVREAAIRHTIRSGEPTVASYDIFQVNRRPRDA